MRIAVDALAGRYGGGAVYLQSLLPGLAHGGPEHDWYALASPKTQPWVARLDPPIRTLDVSPLFVDRSRRLLYEQLILPWRLMRAGVDLVYGPAGVAPWLFPGAQVIALRNLKVHDQLADWRNGSPRLAMLHRLAAISARRARAVICPSEHCRTAVIADLGIPPGRVVAIHHGVGPEFRPDGPGPRGGLRQPYLLCVSTLYRHKNILALIEAFALLVKRQAGLPHDLVIVGEVSDSGYYRQIQEKVITEELQHRVVIVPGMPNSALPEIYRGASAFVLPSAIESFGLPALEAMASGLPVAVSRAGALPEVCQDAAVYFDPSDVEGLADAISRVTGDQELREELTIRSLRRARDFSWEITAQKTLEVFKSAYESNGKESVAA